MSSAIQLGFLLSLLISLQGCSKSAGRPNVPLAVVNGIESHMPEIHLGMSEQEVLKTLGLAPYHDTVMLHSMGAGSFWFTRRYTFPPYENQTLFLTMDTAGHVMRATLAREHDSVEWSARKEPSAVM